MSHGKQHKDTIREKGKVLTHRRTLEILSQLAEQGSVTAAAALERALRAQQREDESDALTRELDAILTK